MIGSDFTFCGYNLSDFGFIMSKPESEDNTGLNREILKGDTNSYRKEAIHYGTKYSDTLLLHFQIVKDPCISQNPYIEDLELRSLQKWLTSNTLPKCLYVEQEDSSYNVEYYGIFTEIEPFYVGGLVGLNLVFTCNSPFCYSTVKRKYELNSDSVTDNIYCDSDEDEYIYPTIQIQTYGDGVFTFNFEEDKNIVVELKGNHTYIIDCKYKTILMDGKSIPLSSMGLTISVTDWNDVVQMQKIELPRFVVGSNNITMNSEANVEVLITYKNIVKVGGLYV